MSRGFLAAIMLLSLVVTGVAGSWVFLRLQEKATVSVPLKTQEVAPTPTTTTEITPSTATLTELDPSTTISQSTSPASPQDPEVISQNPTGDTTTRKTLFRYRSGNAKEVAVVGDFNKWFRQPMKKGKNNVWETTLQLSPGSYTYMYVVDGKRIRDPNNKLVSDDGKSVIQVKPAVQQETVNTP